MTNTIDRTGPWVSVAFMDGDDYETMIDATNDNGGSTGAAVEYLAQWDYGTETDEAHTTDGAQWGPDDTAHEVTFGGIDYVYATNHYMGYVSLNRRPIGF